MSDAYWSQLLAIPGNTIMAQNWKGCWLKSTYHKSTLIVIFGHTGKQPVYSHLLHASCIKIINSCFFLICNSCFNRWKVDGFKLNLVAFRSSCPYLAQPSALPPPTAIPSFSSTYDLTPQPCSPFPRTLPFHNSSSSTTASVLWNIK